MDVDKRNKMQKKVLWIDLEMTGLDPSKDRILEVGAIVTDWNFKEIETHEAVVKATQRLMERRMKKGPSAAFWSSIPETRDALIAQSLDSKKSTSQVEAELLKFIDRHFTKDAPIILAGNSIHADKRFIEKEWPLLNARLHYRMLDVSAWKVVFEGKYKKKFAKREEHRALDDIRGSIEELTYYLTTFKKP